MWVITLSKQLDPEKYILYHWEIGPYFWTFFGLKNALMATLTYSAMWHAASNPHKSRMKIKVQPWPQPPPPLLKQADGQQEWPHFYCTPCPRRRWVQRPCPGGAHLYYLALLCEEGFPGLDRQPGQPTRSSYSDKKLWLNHKFCLFKVLS